jgi:hypothetical protein
MLLKAIEKILHFLLDEQRVCQLNTLLAVIWHFGKSRMFRFPSLLLGIDGLGSFLVAMGLGMSSDKVPFVLALYSTTLPEPQLWLGTWLKSGSGAGVSCFPHRVI